MNTPIVLSKEIFSREVEELVCQGNASYMDAILTVCSRREMEVETAAKLLSSNIKVMLEREAHDLNLLVKNNIEEIDFE